MKHKNLVDTVLLFWVALIILSGMYFVSNKNYLVGIILAVIGLFYFMWNTPKK